MKTIELLWEMNCPVYEIKEGSTKNMLQQIKEQTNFDMLGDAGGYFKNGSNQQTAECIAQLYGMQTVFFDGDGSLAITKTGGKESFAQANVAETHRKTFLDQIHTSGANILQKDDAIGVVTISRNMLLRDLLQSPWRLRKLDKGQKVVFVISQEVKSIIRQTLGLAINETITFEHILLFTIHNQVKQVGKDIFKAMQQDLANIPQMLLFKLIQRKDLTQEQRAKILPCLTEHWIKPANAAPRHLYGQIAVEETKDKTVNSEKAKLTETINKLFADLPFLEEKGYIKQNYLDLIDTITTKLLPLLPDFLTAWEKDGDQTLEEEQQKQMAIETFLEVKEHLHAISTQLGHCPIQVFQKQPYTLDALLKHPKCLPTFPLKSYFEQSEYKDLAPAFDNIDFTINVLEWNENAHKLADFKLLGEHRTPFQNVLVEKNQVTILSQIEAILKKHHPGYYNMTHGFYSNKKHLSQENLERVVKVKFLNGESQFSKNETTVLKDWFAKHDKERLRQLYEHSVLPGYPNKLAQYTTSILHDLFNAPAA